MSGVGGQAVGFMGSEIDRFVDKILVTEGTSCWNWGGGSCAKGYGNFRLAGGMKTGTHRYSYELFVGPIAPGLHIDHLCRNPRCVNPEHLEPVTIRENLLRSPITRASILLAQTRCKRGHSFSEENTHINSKGHRHCRTCGREKQRRHRARKAIREEKMIARA